MSLTRSGARSSPSGAAFAPQEPPLRTLFVNENIGGHAAMHLHLRDALAGCDDVVGEFIDMGPAAGARRVVGTRVPGLGRLDLDLQPLRAQLALSVAARRQVRRRLGSFDALHVYSVNAGLALTDVLAGGPSVVSTDSTNLLNGYSLPYRSPTRFTSRALAPSVALERRVYDAATLVVAQSQWVADSLRNDYGVAPAKTRVIPFGITVPEPVPRQPTDLPEITFIGSSMAGKGGWKLLDIHRKALRHRARLNLVTHDAVAPEPGVRVLQDLTPGDPRLGDLLARTAVFALPSTIDKSSYAVLEAMAAGVPVVTTRVAGLPELVPDGVAGRLVAPGDDGALAAVLGELVDDADQRHRLGRAARERVLERFDASITTARLADVLHEACQRIGRRSCTEGTTS